MATKGASKYTYYVDLFQIRDVLDAEQEIFVMPIWYEEVVLHAERAVAHAVDTLLACETKAMFLFYVNAETANVTLPGYGV